MEFMVSAELKINCENKEIIKSILELLNTTKTIHIHDYNNIKSAIECIEIHTKK